MNQLISISGKRPLQNDIFHFSMRSLCKRYSTFVLGRGCHTEFWLFRTFRAMGVFLQNFLSEDWLSERFQENQLTLIAQLSMESAEEPTFGMVSGRVCNL